MENRKEVPYEVFSLVSFRKTKGVSFDGIPMEIFSKVDAIDRVVHRGGAVSPGPVGGIERPWYMHYHQDDHLFVLSGAREVELYWPDYKRVDRFSVYPERVEKNGDLYFDGPSILAWRKGVFHRIESDPVKGSASVNIAIRYSGFDIKTNFNIYQLNIEKGSHSLLRAGYLDQKT